MPEPSETLRLPCCEIKRVCCILLQACGKMEVFLPYLALAQRNVRLELRGASRTFEVPLRTRSRSSLASLWACRSGRRRVVPLAKSTGTTTDSESFLAAFLPCRLRCGIWRPRKLFPHEFLLTIRRSGRRLGTRPSFTPICPDLSRSVDCASDFFHA